MSKSKKNGKKPKSRHHGIKVVGEPKPTKEKRLSLLDAAATVLRDAQKPMKITDMYLGVIEAKLWSSPAGKTPKASLSAAIQREIARKGDGARFRKVGRGEFEASSVTPLSDVSQSSRKSTGRT